MDKDSLDSFYEAFKSKDKELDGKYFMGVSSTGIYCRPVCTAKMPKKENCTFYKSATEAELNGYRPCLICRPELASGHAKADSITLKLGYQEPFRYEALLNFLAHRAISKVEKIENNKYYKTFAIKKDNEYLYGYIIVENNQEKSALEVTLSESLIKVLPQVLNIVKNIFGLNTDPYTVYNVLEDANHIIPGCFKLGTRIPGSPNDFEMCVRAIIGQLISVEKASEVLSHFCQKYGQKIFTGIEGLEYVFPIPEAIVSIESIYEALCPLKMTRTKADAIKGIAQLLIKENINFKRVKDSKEVKNAMLKIKGIGHWTVDYIAVRSMNETDILLASDYAIKKILKNKKIEDIRIFDKYQPYRSYLTIGLWEMKNK